jgi:hypothetical protein
MHTQAMDRGARKLIGENLKVVWAELSTLSSVVLQNGYIAWPVQIRPSLDLKSLPRFRRVSLSLSMHGQTFALPGRALSIPHSVIQSVSMC